MALTETGYPSTIGLRHLEGCLALSAEAGWNQNADDWSFFIEHGNVFGIMGEGTNPVATGATLPYSGGFAWIGMVLVTAARRRQQLGTRILEACIADLTQRGLVPCLDATPAGEKVYRPLGFEPLFGITRWQGSGNGRRSLPQGIGPIEAEDLPALTALDADAFGAKREELLESLYRRAPHLALMSQDKTGFVLARPGRLATQIGPVVAANEAQAEALLMAALDQVDGPIFIDAVDAHTGLAQRLERSGFSTQRPFLRMAQNRHHPFGDPRRLFAIVGPEFG